MSETEDINTGAIEDRLYVQWIPETGAATFREELDEVETLDVDLKEVYVEMPEDGGEPLLIRVTFDVEPSRYPKLENRNWFGLKPGLAKGMGIEFDSENSIRIIAVVDEDTMDSGIFPDLDPDDPGEGIEELVASLYDEDEFGIESPLGYSYESVSQQTAQGTLEFTPEAVEAFEEEHGPIAPPPEYFE